MNFFDESVFLRFQHGFWLFFRLVFLSMHLAKLPTPSVPFLCVLPCVCSCLPCVCSPTCSTWSTPRACTMGVKTKLGTSAPWTTEPPTPLPNWPKRKRALWDVALDHHVSTPEEKRGREHDLALSWMSQALDAFTLRRSPSQSQDVAVFLRARFGQYHAEATHVHTLRKHSRFRV